MVQVKLLLAVAVTALLLVFIPKTSAGALRHKDSSDIADSDDSDRSSSGESESRRQRPEQTLALSDAHDDSQESNKAVGWTKDDGHDEDGNEALPPHPFTAKGNQLMEEPEQLWESHYKHGIAPARLPALENDNVHSYRHSIIHHYGDDIHATSP